MHRNAVALLVALAAALAVVSLSAAAPASKPHVYHRIISLSPTITEDLFAIGAGKQVIAVDQDSNYPKQRPDRRSLSGYTPNVEAIADYHPDLVLISYNPKGFAGQLRKLGIKVVMEPAATKLAQAYDEIDGVGTAHRPRERRRVGRPLDEEAAGADRRERARRSPASARLPRARPDVLLGDVEDVHRLDLQALRLREHRRRGRGRARSTGYPQLSDEYIVAANPQIIVLADTKCCGQTETTVAARPGLERDQRRRAPPRRQRDDDIASRWGPRIVEVRGRGGEDRQAAPLDGGRGGDARGGAAGRGPRRQSPRRRSRGRLPPRRARRRPRRRAGRPRVRRDRPLGALVRPVSSRPPVARGTRARAALADPRAARRARRARRRDARDCGRVVSGRLPEPALRSVPPRRRRRSGARRDARDRLRVHGRDDVGRAARVVRRSDRRGRRDVRARTLGRRRRT